MPSQQVLDHLALRAGLRTDAFEVDPAQRGPGGLWRRSEGAFAHGLADADVLDLAVGDQDGPRS